MNTHKVKETRNFGIFKGASTKSLINVLFALVLGVGQSVAFSEPVSMMNILGTSLLSPSSEESEEGFLEHFSSEAFPGQPPRNEHKKSPSVQKGNLNPSDRPMSGLKKSDNKHGSSSRYSVPGQGENGGILRKYGAVIDRVNNKNSENKKTHSATGLKAASSSENKLDRIDDDRDTAEKAISNPSLEFLNEPVDFDIDLTETGVVVRYLW